MQTPNLPNKKINMFDRASAMAIGAMALVVFLHFISPAKAEGTTAEDFVRKATVGGLFEIESSKVALQRSQNDGVRQFAQKMVDDHSKVGKELDAVLPKSTVDPAGEAKDLDNEHSKLLESLKDVPDEDFDRTYIKAQRQAHIGAVNLFRNYAAVGTDDILKAFAKRNLSTLEHHLKMANNLHAGVVKARVNE